MDNGQRGLGKGRSQCQGKQWHRVKTTAKLSVGLEAVM